MKHWTGSLKERYDLAKKSLLAHTHIIRNAVYAVQCPLKIVERILKILKSEKSLCVIR